MPNPPPISPRPNSLPPAALFFKAGFFGALGALLASLIVSLGLLIISLLVAFVLGISLFSAAASSANRFAAPTTTPAVQMSKLENLVSTYRLTTGRSALNGKTQTVISLADWKTLSTEEKRDVASVHEQVVTPAGQELAKKVGGNVTIIVP